MKLTEAITPTGIPQSIYRHYMAYIDSKFNQFFDQQTHFYPRVKPVPASRFFNGFGPISRALTGGCRINMLPHAPARTLRLAQKEGAGGPE